MHVFSKQVSDKRDLHCKLLYWMYSTENRQMLLTLKIFLYKFIKTNWRAFTKQANCSGSLRSSKLSFMFPSCCIWRNKRKIRKCHLLLHRVGVSRSKVWSQAKGGTIRKRQRHRKRHWKLTSLSFNSNFIATIPLVSSGDPFQYSIASPLKFSRKFTSW